MKNIKYLSVLGLILLSLATGCFRQTKETLVVSVPGMKSSDCARIILDSLTGVEGVELVLPNVQARTISVTYESTMLARKNIEYLITNIGFEANGHPPSAEARKKLPPGCR